MGILVLVGGGKVRKEEEKIQGFEAEVLPQGYVMGVAGDKQAKVNIWSKWMRTQQEAHVVTRM